MNRLVVYMILLVLVYSTPVSGQTAGRVEYTLQQVVEFAKLRSIDARQAATTRETRYWLWRTYRSNYQPQLSLNGTLPGYSKSFTEVLQPDGTIQFQHVYNNNSNLNLSFSQGIAATGGTIFGTTQLQRFDDFARNNTLYNAVPYGIGYSQPLWQFNTLKWDRKIEPIKFDESKQAFIESMEEVSNTASNYFFDLLLAQVNLEIATTNLQNTEKIQLVADEKLKIGKISKNEILQLQLENLKARKAVGIARRDLQVATLILRSYAGITNVDSFALIPPPVNATTSITTKKVLDEAYENRSDALAFARRIAEAQRDVAKARADNGLNATLTARLGFSKSAAAISKVYEQPRDQQLVQLDFTIPILDWGRSRSRTKTAQTNLQFTEYAVEQDKQIFVQEIVTQVSLYETMKDQVLLSLEADSIATEKYQIARERYVLGNLSITDLSIAFQEKDQAKRDYVAALRDFWGAYFRLRYLSLYDFDRNEKITYR